MHGADLPRGTALAGQARAGDRLALARLLTLIENQTQEGLDGLAALYPHTGRAHVVGITGAPGTGKSTLVNELARAFRGNPEDDQRAAAPTVAIVAVDPSSPFSGGAILGDRIRMRDLSGDPGVFIRSMASRGALGGLARGTAGVVQALDAAGYDKILIETVGAGQAEVDIARAAHTTLVVAAPGFGDDVQALKAGILEIADILVVNKADLPLAEAVYKQLHIFMELDRSEGWRVPILKTVATKGQGVTELVEEIDKHRQYLTRSGRLAEMRRHRARRQLLAAAQGLLLEAVLSTAEANGALDKLVESVSRLEVDPRTAAEQLIKAAKG